MATVTLTPSNYYQVENGYVTAINPSRKYIRSNSAGNQNSYVYVEFDLPSNVRHVIVSDNQVTVSGSGRHSMSYTGRNPGYFTAAGNIAVGTRLDNSGTILFKDGWSSGGGNSHEYVNRLSGVKQKFYIILSPTYIGYSDEYYITSCSLTLTYSTVSTKPTLTLSPASGYVNPTEENVYMVNIGTVTNMLVQYTVSKTVLYYLENGETSYTQQSSSTDGARYVIVPANTLSRGKRYQIYALSTLDDNSTLQTAVGEFSTEDGTAVVTPISPSNEITRGTAVFRWSYYNERGSAQYAYEVSYRVDGGTLVYPTGKVISSDQSVTVQIDTAGTVEWSVRTFNQDDVAGAWSTYLSFTNYVPPSPPTIISVTQSGRPTISWTAYNQIAYEVEVVNGSETVYTSGQIYSGNQSHKLEEYLPDGDYTFKVRIVSNIGLASDWATANYTQSFSLTPPEFTLTDTEYGVQIDIEASSQFTKYYVLRNGELIGSTAGTYTDVFAAGETEYTVIGVTANDESAFATQSINHRVTTTTLKLEDGTVINASRRWNQRISPTKSVEPEFGLFSYIGASRPEIITSKMRNVRYGFGFHDVNRIAETLIGQPLFYSDIFGNADWVQITAISRTDVWYGNETTLELTVVLHEEGAEYDT